MKDPSGAFNIAGYEIVRRLAAGGMGSVFVARKVGPFAFTKLVAIKRLHPQLEYDEESQAMRRFGVEARLGAELRHPNIVDVFDFGHDAEGVFIVMEYVHGVDMANLMRAREKRHEGGLPPALAAHILSEVLHGLQAAHEHVDEEGRSSPVVHRDLTSRNVLFSDRGEVKITDFGIALILEDGAQQSTASRGTFAYMSPEQARGEPLDVRTDIYSCGLLFYELLTGDRAIGGTSPAEMLEQAKDGVGPDVLDKLDGATSILRPIVEQALASDRTKRYASAAAFRAEVERFIEASVLIPRKDEVAALVRPLAGRPPIGSPSRERMTALIGGGVNATAPTSAGLPSDRERGRRRRRGLQVFLGLTVILAGLASFFALREPAPTPPASRPALTVAQDSGVARSSPDSRPLTPDLAPSSPDSGPADARSPDVRRKKKRKRPRRARGWLEINTIPVWSTLVVDGKRRGNTPRRLRLTAGTHRVTLRALGRGRARTFTVHVRAGASAQKVFRVPRPAK